MTTRRMRTARASLGIGQEGQETDRKGAHVTVDEMGQEGEPQQGAGEREAAAAADGVEGNAQGEEEEMRADGLRKESAARPDEAAVLHAVEEIGGNERGQNGGGRGGERTESHEPGRRKETQRQQDDGEEARPHEDGHQANGLAKGEVCERDQGVGEGLIGAEHGIAERPLGRPAIEGIFAALDGLHDAFGEGKVEDVVVQIHAADGEFGPESSGVDR